MTQQPFYPQQVQQPYPGQPAAYPQPPAPPAQPQYPSYPQQAYPPQQVQQPFPTQQPPAQPLAQGSIDDFYNQPSVGGGPSISWTNKDGTQKPIGTSYAGLVARDVTQADVQQETDFKTQQPKFFRDGRPKFVMKVPLRVQPSPEYPDGEAAWYVKGQARDELVRAMAEAGCSGAPKAGATVIVTLVQRKPMGTGMNPANIVQVQYQPNGGQQAPAQAAPVATSPAPEPPQQAPVQQQQQYQQAPVQQQAPAPQQVAPQQQVAAQQQPVQQAPQAPPGLSPEQQQLLAQMTGQQG